MCSVAACSRPLCRGLPLAPARAHWLGLAHEAVDAAAHKHLPGHRAAGKVPVAEARRWPRGRDRSQAW